MVLSVSLSPYFVSTNVERKKEPFWMDTVQSSGTEAHASRIIRLNGVCYKRQDGPFSAWKLLSVQEKRVRMREYMRQYRVYKRQHC